jgi:predicted nuclease of predicted toxin-antitoxin system
MAGQKDWDVARHAQENDFVLVTNNASDFRALYASQELHPGLVILIPNVKADLQGRLFTGVLEQLAETGEPVNRVLEGSQQCFEFHALQLTLQCSARKDCRGALSALERSR